MYVDKYNIKLYNDEVQKIKYVAKLFRSINERVLSVGGDAIIPSSSGVQYTVDDLNYVIKVLNNCAEDNINVFSVI